MFSNNGNNYSSSHLDYSEYYRNRMKKINDAESEIKKSGEYLMNSYKQPKFLNKKTDNFINYSNSTCLLISVSK